MSMNTFDAFGPLDELIQVIYQGPSRFVLLSRVDFDALVPSWTVHLGLADKGRWWRGRWEEDDVNSFVGKNVETEMLEAFVDNVVSIVTQGELFISGWSASQSSSPESSADIKIIFGPNGKKPLSIPLKELEKEEATVFVTNEFFTLGLSAQQRKCKLNPPAFPTYISAPVAAPAPTRRRSRSRSPPPTKKARISTSPPGTHTKLGAASERKVTKVKTSEPPATKSNPGPAMRSKPAPTKKKARKVQNMEFASDDD